MVRLPLADAALGRPARGVLVPANRRRAAHADLGDRAPPRGHGVPLHVYRTGRPGIVVYKDHYQVAAVPWRDTFANKMHAQA
jgi:hypothetical protein